MENREPTRDLKIAASQYALSHMGKALLWVAADTYTLYYLTNVARLPAAVAAWFFLALLFWSAACDLAVGWLCDRLSPDAARLRIVIRVAAFVAVVAFAATFVAPSSGKDGWVWLALASFLFRTAYSVFDVPHNALLARLVEAGAPAMPLASARLGLNMVATLIATGAASWLLLSDVALSQHRFTWGAIVWAAASGAAVLAGIPKVRRPTPETSRGEGRVHAPVWAMFAVATLGALLTSILFKALFYFADYTLDMPAWAPQALMFATLGKLVGAMAWGAVASRRIGPLNANRCACLATFLVALGLIPIHRQIWMMDAGIFLLGVALSGTVIAPWAALSDRVAWRGNTGATWFGLFTALSKIGIGVSGWLLAMLLSILDITPGRDADAWQGSVLFLVCIGVLAGGAAFSLLLLRAPSRAASARC
jgi:Na+/melibiose symporter-like transporter